MGKTLSGLGGCVLVSLACCADASTPTDMSHPFDHYAWVTTHNAFTSNGMVPNQSQTIAEQLDHGVRGFMLDLYDHQGRVALCHKTCTNGPGTQRLADLMNGTIMPFLTGHPDAIVSLQLEDFTTAGMLKAELEKIPGLGGKTFDPYAWTTPGWPTYEAMVSSGQRILIFSLNRDHTGTIMTTGGGVHIMPSEVFTVENYWSLGMTPLRHDNRCRSRWSDDVQPLSRQAIDGKPGWRPLFTMNQFHGVPFASHAASDNAFDRLHSRYLSDCLPVAGRKPNFVAVDFHERGDVATFVDWLTQDVPDGPH